MSVPVIFWLLLTGRTQLAFLIFVLAGISDAVDGYLAKRFDWRTELGAYLDPLADKLLIVSIYIALGVRGELPLWLIIMVVSRDILIVAGGAAVVADGPAGGASSRWPSARPTRSRRSCSPPPCWPTTASVSACRRCAGRWCGLRGL